MLRSPLLAETYGSKYGRKYGAIWIGVEEDGAAKVAFENYMNDKLHVIYIQRIW